MVGAFGLGDLFARLEAERGTMMALVMALVMELVRLREARGVRSEPGRLLLDVVALEYCPKRYSIPKLWCLLTACSFLPNLFQRAA